MKILAFTLILGLAFASVFDTAKMIDGFLLGCLDEQKIYSVRDCLKDDTLIISKTEQMFEMFAQGKSAEGVQFLGEVITEIGHMISDCRSINKTDIEHMSQMIQVFSNPIELFFKAEHNWMHNQPEVHSLVEDAEQQMKDGKYESAGESFGRAISIILYGKQTLSEFNEKEFAEIISGILVGALDAEVLGADSCIKDGAKVIKEIEEAVEDFKKNTFKSMTEGIVKIGKAAKMISKDIKECKVVVTNIDDLFKMGEQFANPVSFVFHVGKDLIVNRKDIFSEITDSVNQWNQSNFFLFGKDVGMALAQMIVGEE